MSVRRQERKRKGQRKKASRMALKTIFDGQYVQVVQQGSSFFLLGGWKATGPWPGDYPGDYEPSETELQAEEAETARAIRILSECVEKHRPPHLKPVPPV